MDIVEGNMGWIEVIVGPMFSGKSEELIRRLRRAEIARQRVQIFSRPSTNATPTTGLSPIRAWECVPTTSPMPPKFCESRAAHRGHPSDKAQFLGDGLVEACTKLADTGKRVIVSGLDTDFLAAPSSPCPHCWPWRRKSPSFSQYACAAATRPCTPSGWSRQRT